MSKWDSVTLSELCDLEKGKTGLMKAVPGEYPLVATGKDRRTCDTYQFDAKAVCIPLVSSTGHGHASLKYVHYQEGKFALGTILVAAIPKDENVLNAQFLHLYLSRLKDTILVPLMTGAANVTLTVTKLKTVKVPLPPIKEQLRIVSLFNRMDNKQADLADEISKQQTLLKKLRQSILHDAIEGNLTASWREQNPDVESASVLLEKIKSEKEKLIKEKKIKKQKPLPLINEDEIPFDIPNSWEWCRTNDACTYIVDCPHSTPKFIDNGFKCIDTTCINMDGEILDNKIRMVSEKTFIERNNRLIPQLDDIIYSREGIVGQAVIVPKDFPVCLGQRVMLFRTYAEIPSKFFRYVVTSRFFLQEMIARHRGIGAKHVNMKDLRESIIPLPPLEEQKEIVKRIENIFKICDELEEQINSSKANSEMLMQAVLKEAFEDE